MSTESRRPFWGYLFLSLLLHLFLWLFPALLPTPQPTLRETIEMDLVEATPPPAKPVIEEKLKIVDQDKTALNNDLDDKAKFLAAHNQKVLKETLAQQRGEFQNRKQQGQQGDGSPQAERNAMDAFIPKMDIAKAIKDRLEMEQKFDEDAEFRERKKQERKEPKAASAQKEPGTSAGADTSKTLDYIKELDPGLETLLSTKEFKYYTYFSRIRQQLNQHWTPRVRVKVAEIYKQGRSIASSDDMITRCLVTLDKNGRLLRIQIIGDSGIRELDEAAVDAFRAAAPFPNPPKGMIDPDGTIKIRWDFILEA